jgi:uncharacterized protein
MLLVDVRSLAVHAVAIDGALALDDEVWLPGDTLPDAPLAVTGRLSSAGGDRFYFTGRLAGAITVDCRRCLVPVTAQVESDVTAIFSAGVDDDADDPDFYPLAEGGKKVDLRPVIREQWLLNVPAFAECRPDCRGLCPTCGTDLNTGTCSCVPAPDRRWAALRATRSQAD